MLKILISDLDGTLLTYGVNKTYISEYNTKQINKWKENNYFTIATGRNITDLKMFLNEANITLKSIVVCLNGSLVYDLNEDKPIYIKNLPKEYAYQIIKHFKENDLGSLNVNGVDYYQKVNTDINEKDYKILLDRIAQNEIIKIGLHFDNSKYNELESLLKSFPKSDEISIKKSSNNYLDIQHIKSSKQTGILKMIELLNVDKYKTYAVGDYSNDYEMLIAAHVSFAPDNAGSHIKEIVDYLLPHHNLNAVGVMIDKIIKEDL